MYPDITVFDTGYLDVGSGHQLYYEICGNPDGIPAVFLHGGPGGGFLPRHKQLFDPAAYKLVIFDQRGAGQSKYQDIFADNSPAHLVADIETLRNHLGIDRWVVAGGSWGSALGVLYATTHPERVMACAFSGIFFGDKSDAAWLAEETGAGAKMVPEFFNPYRDHIPADKRGGGLIKAYHDIMKTGTDAEILTATELFTVYDTALLTWPPDLDMIAAVRETPSEDIQLNKIFFHFAENHFKTHDRAPVLAAVSTLGDIPCVIVHGGQDYICRPDNAYDLHKAWPNSVFHFLPMAAHTMRDAIAREVSCALDGFTRRF